MSRFKQLLIWCCLVTTCSHGSDIGDALDRVVNMIKHNPKVQTTHGWVLGRKNHTIKLNKEYYIFQGIPYAKPPVGDLRFKEPQPPEPWNDLRAAIREGNICMQPHKLSIIGSEDCLFINVYTPQLPHLKGPPIRFPVMVWIHGGDFIARSGNTDVFGPDFLIEKDVVVVTFNYRLGIFGFLSTEDQSAPGNIGLKDQVFALKWVQDNIEQFGGDAKKVTIFGQSAGGASVSYQVLSPLSKGLFVGAIAQSGSSIAKWAYTRNPRVIAFRTGEILKVHTNSSSELIQRLRRVDSKTLLRASFVSLLKNETFASQKLLMDDTYLANSFLINPLDGIPFTPTIEPPGSSAFISESPYEILKQGKFNRVPYMTGFVSSEGLITLRSHPTVEKTKPFETNPELLVPWDLNVTRGSDESKEIARKIQQFYFNNETSTLQNFVNYVSDVDFVKPIRQTVKLISEQRNDVYLYQFSFEGDLGRAKLALQTRLEGTTHGDDNGYIWLALDHNQNPDSAASLTRDRMVSMWTNFAKTGNPTPDLDLELMNIQWPKAVVSSTSTDIYYMDIGEKLSILKNPRETAMQFWDRIYSNYKKGNYIIF